jgi:shikimate 5-dehydrogenase
MTRSRTSTARELLGILGPHPDARVILQRWNTWFREQGIDASMDRYPATAETLPERLSEMVHYDRRGSIVAPALQRAIVPLLDDLDASVEGQGRVDTLWNDGGVVRGYLLESGERSPAEIFSARARLWFPVGCLCRMRA